MTPDIPEAEADPFWLSNPGGSTGRNASYLDPKIFYVTRPFPPAPVIRDGMITFRDGQVHRLRWWERWGNYWGVYSPQAIERARRPNLCRAIEQGFFTGRLRVRQRASEEMSNVR